MANEEHLKILEQGGEAWNRWREENPGIFPELSDANLNDADLSNANFSNANLSNANLSGANLNGANLRNANLRLARFLNANLSGANLSGADLLSADLYFANFSGADLGDAILANSNLSGAKFNRAIFGGTVLANLNLNDAQGLETCGHYGPSIIEHRTLAKSGQLPLSFLRNVGLPDTYIDYIPSLFNQSLQFYSCFISYSSKDQEFAERLYADLQNRGVRCWYAPEDLPIGAKIRIGIDEAIRRYDKLLLILSENSVNSQWVEQEVETALEKERERNNQIVLFPVRLDNAVMESGDGWTRLIKNTRNIGDFCQWKDHDAYQKTFERLVKDLKASLVAKG
ncbi:MAG: toll/interleukin-1 receptor domain-containing protein [Cyanobacteria bacterium P01_C01_bin.118]